MPAITLISCSDNLTALAQQQQQAGQTFNPFVFRSVFSFLQNDEPLIENLFTDPLTNELYSMPAYPPNCTLTRCAQPDCGTFTSGFAELGGHRHWALCTLHRTRDCVEALARG